MSFQIGDRIVGRGAPCFVIAEAGVNHNGDIDLATALVDAAADARADAVKFQTFKTELLVTRDAPQADYQKVNTRRVESQFDMLKRLELGEADHVALKKRCSERGIVFLSTPFEEESADLLHRLDVPAYKISSGELTNLPFLAHIARFGRPVILSTGMASLEDVRGAVDTIRSSGNPPLVLLQCVSNYPADPKDVNLRAMRTMAHEFGVPVGFSDHTVGNAVACAAVALGAVVVEKHFTLDRTLPGPDHKASLLPHELAALIGDLRAVEASMGTGEKAAAASEANTASVARKSLVAATDLRSGAILKASDIAIRRPGNGLPPAMMASLVGRRLRVDLKSGSLFSESMFE